MTSEPTEPSDVSTSEAPSSNTHSEGPDAAQTAPSPPPEEEAPDASLAEEEASAEREALQQTITNLEEENAQLNDRLLRTAAEFENFRRRAKRQKKRRYEAGKVDAVRGLLDVLDDFERSIDAADQMDDVEDLEAAYTSLKGGIEMIIQKFQDDLESLGVTPIEAEGEPFDESLHEAMMQQPAPDDVAPGTVLQEIRKGYRLGDRVIRHSRVIVASDAT